MKLSSRRRGYKGKRASSTEGDTFSSDNTDLPQFSTLMRSIYKRCHPDLLRARFPEEASANEQGLQTINSVLDTIKKFNSFPPQIIKTIPLALLSENGNDLRSVTLRIKTAGGDCRRSLTSSFADLFIQAELIKDYEVDENLDVGMRKKGKKSKKKQRELFVWNEGFFKTSSEGEED